MSIRLQIVRKLSTSVGRSAMGRVFSLLLCLFLLHACKEEPTAPQTSRRVNTKPLIKASLPRLSAPQIDSLVAKMSVSDQLRQLVWYKPDPKSKKALPKNTFGGLVLQDLDRQSVLLEKLPTAPQLIYDGSQLFNKGEAPIAPLLESVSDDKLLRKYLDATISQRLGKNRSLVILPDIDWYATRAGMLADQKPSLGLHAEVRFPLMLMERLADKGHALGLYLNPPGLLDTTLTEEQRQDRLCPYAELVQAGCKALVLPADLILSLSPELSLTDWASQNLGFKGLLIADLSGASQSVSVSTPLLISKGVDIVLTASKPDQVLSALNRMANAGKLETKGLNLRLKKELRLMGEGDKLLPVKAKKIASDLQYDLYKNALVLLRNKEGLIPLQAIGKKPIRLIIAGEDSLQTFVDKVKAYAPVELHRLRFDKNDNPQFPKFKDKTDQAMILAMGKLSPTQYEALGKRLPKLSKLSPIILVSHADPHHLIYFDRHPTILQAHHSHEQIQALSPQVVFGALYAEGEAPMALSASVDADPKKYKLIRPSILPATEAGLDLSKLYKIKKVAIEGIKARAMPGCQVAVLKGGNLVYQESFGYHTYAQKRAVQNDDLYDLASITKIAATTLATMKLYEEGRINLDAKLGDYFKDTYIDPDLMKVRPQQEKQSRIDALLRKDYVYLFDKKLLREEEKETKITAKTHNFSRKIRDILIHKSGMRALPPVLPYISYIDSVTPRYGRYFQPNATPTHTIEVAENFFMNDQIFDSLRYDLRYLRIYFNKPYKYSDLGMIFLHMAIDSLNQQKHDAYLWEQFYGPMGLTKLGYNPLRRFTKSQITPTELDTMWRKQLVHGHVHDPSAAIWGGVAGNAGLFSNATDLALLMQMLLNGGTYGGKRYLKESTIKKFTQTQPGSTRGLGFHKQGRKGRGTVSRSASMSTYGHTGFTGTCVWVDPAKDLVYVFLSNRVHPDAHSKQLNRLKIRRRVHDVIYEAMR